MVEEYDFRLKDIDEGLNNWIINQINLSSEFYYRGDLRTTFRIYKLIFKSISCYDYNNKEEETQITNTLEEYFDSLGSKPADQYEKLILGQKSYEVKYLIDVYYELLVSTLNSIGKWLKVYKIKEDHDEQFSRETFGTSLTLLDEKTKELSLLSSKEILKLCSPNIIHFLHGRKIIRFAKENY